jgi:hypothetical protein
MGKSKKSTVYSYLTPPGSEGSNLARDGGAYPAPNPKLFPLPKRTEPHFTRGVAYANDFALYNWMIKSDKIDGKIIFHPSMSTEPKKDNTYAGDWSGAPGMDFSGFLHDQIKVSPNPSPEFLAHTGILQIEFPEPQQDVQLYWKTKAVIGIPTGCFIEKFYPPIPVISSSCGYFDLETWICEQPDGEKYPNLEEYSHHNGIHKRGTSKDYIWWEQYLQGYFKVQKGDVGRLYIGPSIGFFADNALVNIGQMIGEWGSFNLVLPEDIPRSMGYYGVYYTMSPA